MTLTGLMTALGIGLLIGVVRERGHREDTVEAGTRTHALVALLGFVSLNLGTWPFVATLVVIGALVVGGYHATARNDPGQTGEVALLVTLMLAALATQEPALSAGLGVLAALLLYAKRASKHISRVLITEQELQDGLMLAAAALVVMPLLPPEPIDPWGALELTTLWRIVVLVMAVGMVGHVAQRALGGRWGLPLAAFFSGFVSSTAVVASTGQRTRAGLTPAAPAAASALLSNLASLSLFAGVVGTVSPLLMTTLGGPLAMGGAALLLVALPALRRSALQEETTGHSERAFKLSHALAIAGLIAAMSLVAALLQQTFGDIGVLVAALCVAWVEVHAAAASIAQLMNTGGMAPESVHWAIVAVLASSALAKTLLACVSGGVRFGLTVGLGLMAMTAGTAVGVWWQG